MLQTEEQGVEQKKVQFTPVTKNGVKCEVADISEAIKEMKERMYGAGRKGVQFTSVVVKRGSS